MSHQPKMKMFFLFFLLAAVAAASDFIPEERTAVVPKDKALEFIHRTCVFAPTGITEFWTPSPSDADGIEVGLIAFLRKVRPEAAEWLTTNNEKKLKNNWAWFRRQVIGVTRGQAKLLLVAYWVENPLETAVKEKEIRAKAGERYREGWWKDSPLSGQDGGYTFFRVMFDLKRREFVWYDENPS